VNRFRLLLAIAALLVLGAVNYSIFVKEDIKRNGELMYIDLQPVDPRSIMQGDYMALRFRLAEEIERSLPSEARPREGEKRLVEVALDDRRVASLAKLGSPPKKLHVQYRMRKGSVWLGTNAFFFEEGSDQRYAPARYGEFRVDTATGEAVLVGLRDARFKPL
jgi:uncharacterized membrane-anchored protein